MYALAAEATPEAIDALNRAYGLCDPWSLPSPDIPTRLPRSPLALTRKLLASGSQDHTARIWDANTGQVLHVLSADPSQAIAAVSFSPGWEPAAHGGEH